MTSILLAVAIIAAGAAVVAAIVISHQKNAADRKTSADATIAAVQAAVIATGNKIRNTAVAAVERVAGQDAASQVASASSGAAVAAAVPATALQPPAAPGAAAGAGSLLNASAQAQDAPTASAAPAQVVAHSPAEPVAPAMQAPAAPQPSTGPTNLDLTPTQWAIQTGSVPPDKLAAFVYYATNYSAGATYADILAAFNAQPAPTTTRPAQLDPLPQGLLLMQLLSQLATGQYMAGFADSFPGGRNMWARYVNAYNPGGTSEFFKPTRYATEWWKRLANEGRGNLPDDQLLAMLPVPADVA